MTLGLAIACGVLFCAAAFLSIALNAARRDRLRLRTQLERFSAIADLEEHADNQRQKAQAALDDAERAHSDLERIAAQIEAHRATITTLEGDVTARGRELAAASALLGEYKSLDDIRKQIEKQKRAVGQYNQALGMFKTAAELKTHVDAQRRKLDELGQAVGKFATITELDQGIVARTSRIGALESRICELQHVLGGADTAVKLGEQIQRQEAVLEELKARASELEEALEMQEFGFYRPRFAFESSSVYQQNIDQIRQRQTSMVKANAAVTWDKTWLVEGSDAKGRKMMAEQTKLLLRAFNGECDAAIAKVKYNNAVTLENRIVRACAQINKLAKTNTASINDQFLQLKLDELHLVHEYQVKLQREREEQRQIREMMREEERAQREIADAEEEAEKEERAVARALDRARQTFELATRDQIAITEEAKANNVALATQVAKLEGELKEAIDRKVKAIARAQLTKSGHLYVLSNVGSFGEGMYKIGMTRRFEPLERVKELGDASVPFPFDVHAVIYCENAPTLEYKLHQHFADRRVNLINLRREYSRVSLEEIIAAVGQYHGEITFVKFPEAAEYRETLAKRKAVMPAETSAPLDDPPLGMQPAEVIA